MQRTVFLGALLAAALLAVAATGATLDDVKTRGKLICGVNSGLPGFAAKDANGVWSGFDISLCRAIAAAIFADPNAVEFTPLSDQSRFNALAAGNVDMLAPNSTWTFSRDTDRKVDFVAVNYYDGQGFMVPKALGITSAKELDGRKVCVQSDTAAELNVGDFFRINNITYEKISVPDDATAAQQYLSGACEVLTTDASGLAAVRATFENPGDHVILPEIISKEPLGPSVRHGDNAWGDIVRWTFYALVSAEELGVTSANIDEMAKAPTNNPEVNRLLGTEGELGSKLGLSKDWAYNAIKAGGNYGEIFEKNIGENTPIGLPRGLNAQWKNGGLMYAPPFR